MISIKKPHLSRHGGTALFFLVVTAYLKVRFISQKMRALHLGLIQRSPFCKVIILVRIVGIRCKRSNWGPES